jgi:very-short-patch-repair endonuclease
MRKASIPLDQLKKSACADLNQHVFEELKKPANKKSVQLPGQMREQAQWMWGQLSWWSIHTGILVVKEKSDWHPVRKWRFDFAVPDKKIAIEYEGLMSEKSGHTTLKGYTKDTEKYNAAQALGWTVIRFTVKNYKTVLKELEKHINNA